MNARKVLLGAGLLLALAVVVLLVGLGFPVAHAASGNPPTVTVAKTRIPYSTSVQCSEFANLICVKNIDPVPAGKRFVVEYVTVTAFTDKPSDQRLLVWALFSGGKVYPVLQFQGAYDTANHYQASEQVLAFAQASEEFSGGQLYVNRTTNPEGGYETQVRMCVTGYLEDVN